MRGKTGTLISVPRGVNPALSRLTPAPATRHTAAPHPGTTYERVDYDLTLSCTVGLLCSYLAAGLLLDETGVMVAMSAVMLAGAGGFAYLNGRVDARRLARCGLVGVVAAAVLTNVLFPVGGTSLIFAVNTAQLIYWEVDSGRVAAILIAVLFLVPVVSWGLGYGGGVGVTSPDYVVVGIGAIWSAIYAVTTMRHARVAYAGAHARLSATEARIVREVASL